jgi:hypothetical protein
MIGLSLLLVLIQTAYGQLSIIPLSSSEYSYQKGNSDSKVKVELFIDLTCRFASLPSFFLPSKPSKISSSSATLDAWSLLNEVVATYQKDVLFE